MKILYLDEIIPWPPYTGGVLRSWQFIKVLYRYHELHLICYNNDSINPKVASDKLNTYFKTITLINKKVTKSNYIFGSKMVSFLDSQLSTPPFEYSRDFYRAIRKKISDEHFDIIFARYVKTAQYILSVNQELLPTLVIDVVDLYPNLEDQIVGLDTADGFAYRTIKKIKNIIIKKRFYDILREIKATKITSSVMDNKHLLKNNIRPVVIIPNTIDVSFYDKKYQATAKSRQNKTILFCGTLSWRPNFDALAWFIYEIFPIIINTIQNVQLEIVGSYPSTDIKSLIKTKNIHIHQNVKDVRQYYAKADVVIVPLRAGSGTRIKILEAMACKKPVVTTKIGAEGLDLEDHKHCLIADTPSDFAKAVTFVLSRNIETKEIKAMTANAYRLVRKAYDNKVTKDQILNIFKV
jgi:glycosyltransferase involved in cell wall biosynthesis